MGSLDSNKILQIYEARINDLESLLEIGKSLSSNLHYSSVLDAILLTCMGRARVLKQVYLLSRILTAENLLFIETMKGSTLTVK